MSIKKGAKVMQSKLITAEEAIAKIKDGDSVVVGGFVGSGHPEALTSALEERFVKDGHPRDVNLIFVAGQGDGKDSPFFRHLRKAYYTYQKLWK